MIKEKSSEATGEIQLVVFDLASEHYGVDISTVREIIRMQTITRVPGAYFFVEGVINLRGKVLPVIDLRKRLGLKVSEDTKESRIVVIDIAVGEVGLLVDAVSEVLRIPKSSIEPASSVITGANSDCLCIAKLSDRLIILIDPNRVLASTGGEEIDYRSIVDAMKSAVGKASKGAVEGSGSLRQPKKWNL